MASYASNLIRRFSSGGSDGSGGGKKIMRKRALSMPNIECSLQLDGNHMTLTRDGSWKLDKSTLGSIENEKNVMKQRIKDLEQDKVYLINQYKKSQEEKMMLEFRNKILVEMLACSQLDCEKNNDVYQRELLRCKYCEIPT